MSNHILGNTTIRSMQTQYQDQQSKFIQPRDNGNEDKGGRLLAEPAKGSKKQLVGTVVGIAAVFAALIVLKLLDVI